LPRWCMWARIWCVFRVTIRQCTREYASWVSGHSYSATTSQTVMAGWPSALTLTRFSDSYLLESIGAVHSPRSVGKVP